MELTVIRVTVDMAVAVVADWEHRKKFDSMRCYTEKDCHHLPDALEASSIKTSILSDVKKSRPKV